MWKKFAWVWRCNSSHPSAGLCLCCASRQGADVHRNWLSGAHQGPQCHTLMSLGEGWRWGQSLPKRVALEKVFPRFSSSTVFHSNCCQQERSRGGKWGLVTGANYCSKLNILHVQEVPPTKEWEQTLVPERGGYHPGRATKSNRAIAESTSRGCVMMQWVQSVRNFP